MKLTRLRLAGMLRFTDPVEVDFTALPQGLIAITGGNGEGKTALLEAPLAALYRKFPSRDRSLADYCCLPKGEVRAWFELTPGEPCLEAAVWVNRKSRQTESLLKRDLQLLTDGKVSTYDEWVSAHLPSLGILLASAFSCQDRRGSFAKLDRAGRKDLFGQLLGLARYDEMAQSARTITQRVQQRLDGSQGALEALTRLDTADVSLDVLQARLESADGHIRAMRNDEQAIDDKASKCENALSELEAELVLCREDCAMVAAATQAAKHSRLLLQQSQERMSARMSEKHKAKEILSSAAQIQQRVDDTEQHNTKMRSALATLNTSTEMVRELTERQRVCEVFHLKQSHREERLKELRQRRDRRGDVPCGGVAPYASCHFLADAAKAREEMLVVEAEIMAAQEEAESGAIVATQLHDAQECLEAHKAEHDALASASASLVDVYAEKAALDTAISIVEQSDREIATEQSVIEQLATDIAYEERIARDNASATTQIQELQEASARLRGEQVTIRDESTRVITEIVKAVEQKETIRSEMHRYAKRQKETQRLRDLIERDREQLDEWGMLATAFGRTGLPVFEIDASGPTVSAICNDLLQASFGGRFSVALTTQAEKKTKGRDGSTMKEVFTINITDSERPGEMRDLTDLSGGEQIIVDEALKAALAVFCNRRSDVPIRTCWRDETTGPLDADNSDRYISMLRRLLTLGNFDQIIYITHSEDAAAQADAQIHVKGGQVSITQ